MIKSKQCCISFSLDVCHEDPSKVKRMFEKGELCECPAGPMGKALEGECPLGIPHPPTGEEFVLGCGLCREIAKF